MVTIKGVWKFNDTFIAPTQDVRQDLNYTFVQPIDKFAESIGISFLADGRVYIYYRNLEGGTVSACAYYNAWMKPEYQTIDFGSTAQEVSDEWYACLTANATLLSAPEEPTTATVITYNNETIATLEAGQTATIKTAETEVEHDIVITPAFPIEIAYGDIIATANEGQTATIKCANTELEHDIVVSAKEEEDDITDLTGTWLLNEVLMPTESGVSLDVNFNSTNSSGVAYEYNSLQRAYWGTVWKLSYIYSGNYMHTAYQEDTGWKDVAYRTITITSTLAEVTNGQELLEWLKANATKQ